jgi:pyrroloquinoline quinone biosynthesis protein B
VAFAILLGNAQDAGVPQAGCACANCQAAWADARKRRLAAALGLVDAEAGLFFLVDATPDVREQLHALQAAAPGARLGGVLLTHAHLGHYTGLLHFGFEAMDTRAVPLYATPRLLEFLRANAPWRQLVAQGNVAPCALAPGEWLALSPGLSVQPVAVPHRAEWSDTVGYVVMGRGTVGHPAAGRAAERGLLYLPDIDSWETWAAPPWGQEVREVAARVDVALLDGSFYSPEELPGRDLAAIGHPLATDTAERLAGLRGEIALIHLNHTNPLHYPGPERAWLAARGLQVAEAGMKWEL